MRGKFMSRLSDGTVICHDHGALEDETPKEHVKEFHPDAYFDVLEKLAEQEDGVSSCPSCGEDGATKSESSYPIYCLNDSCRVDMFRSEPESGSEIEGDS